MRIRSLPLTSLAASALLACASDPDPSGGAIESNGSTDSMESTESGADDASSTSVGAEAGATDGLDTTAGTDGAETSGGSSAPADGSDDRASSDGESATDDRGSSDDGSGIDDEGSSDTDAPDCIETADCTGNTVWTRVFGNPPPGNPDESVNDVAVAPSGRIAIVGWVATAIDMHEAGLLQGPGIHVASLDPDGSVLWVRLIEADSLSSDSIGVDDQGNVTVTGNVAGTLVIGDEQRPAVGDSSDVFVASFDQDGDFRFAQRFGSASGIDRGQDIAVAPDGSFAVVGDFRGSINFGGNLLSSTGGSSYADVYVAVFEGDGTHRWSRRFGDNVTQEGHSVGFDPAGRVVVACRHYGTIDFGNAPLQSPAGPSLSLASLDGENGAPHFSRQYAPTSGTAGSPVLTVGNDAIFLGTYNATAGSHVMDFGNGPLEGDFFLVSTSLDGEVTWSRALGGYRGVYDIAADANSGVVFVGSFEGSIDFGDRGTPVTASFYDVFALKLDGPTGASVWSRVFTDYDQQANVQQAFGVGVGPASQVYVGGSFRGSVHFGDAEYVSGSGFGGSDAFLVALEP